MKKIILIVSLLGCFSTTSQADPLSSLVIPQAAEAIIEEVAQIIDDLITVSTPENKEWAKYLTTRRQAIIVEYQTARKASLTQFRSCTGDEPTYEQSTACSETHAKNMQRVKLNQKEEFKALLAENKKHTERLNKKRELLVPSENTTENTSVE